MATYDDILGVWVEDAGPRVDGWVNGMTGLGTSRDRAMAGQYEVTGCDELDPETCVAMLTKDDIAARIVEAPVKEMFRKGYELKIKDEQDQELAEEFAEQAEELEVDRHVRESMIWGRGTGGAILFVNANDGQDPKKPLNEKRITSIDSLNMFDSRWARPARYYADPLMANFGRPEAYWLTNIEGGAPVAEVHESRCIRFGGSLTDVRARRRRWGWDYSVLQRPYTKMRAFDMAFQAAGHALTDFSQGVWGIDGLFAMIASGQKDVLATRMRELEQNRGVARAIMIDKEKESFQNVARSFAQVPDLLDRFMYLLASAAEMPVSILMGRSPAGMNATGESDFQAWYDVIAAMQIERELPPLKKIYRLMSLAKQGPSGGKEQKFEFLFRPLKEMTDKERAELENTTATKDVAYINAGVLTPEEVALSRFGGGEWSPETTIDIEARQAAQKSGESFDPYPADPDDVPGAVPLDPNDAANTQGPDAQMPAAKAPKVPAAGEK